MDKRLDQLSKHCKLLFISSVGEQKGAKEFQSPFKAAFPHLSNFNFPHQSQISLTSPFALGPIYTGKSTISEVCVRTC